MDYYYLGDNGVSAGPMPAEAIRGLRKAGVVHDGTLIVAAGSEQWAPYASVFGSGSAGTPPAKSSKPVFLIVGIIAAVLMLSLAVVVGAAVLFWGTRPSADQESGSVGKAPVPPKRSTMDAEALRPMPPPATEVVASPTEPAAAGVLPPTSSVPSPAPSAPPVSPPPVPAPASLAAPMPQVVEETEPTDPLAEWYEFGYRQGTTAERVLGAFGQRPMATRVQLFQLMKNLGVEAAGIGAAEMDLCLHGYKDALTGKPMAMKLPPEQLSSILPDPMRGYHRFKESFLAEDSGDFAAKARAATVMIFAFGPEGGQGSGFFVAPGIIVTNRHVIEGGERLVVIMPDKSQVPAELIRASTAIDAAVLRIDREDHPVLKFASSEAAHPGTLACAVGFPQSETLAIASGTLDLGKAILELSTTSTYGRIGGRQRVKNTQCLQLDLTINSGNSGGPVVNKDSDVIGVSTYGLTGRGVQGMNFAVEGDLVKQFVLDSVPGIVLD